MAVLCEAISVIIKKHSIEKYYRGGWDYFLENIPNSTMCTDEILVRIGFMSPVEVQEYVEELVANGLQFQPPTIGGLSIGLRKKDDITVVDQQKGPMVECGWIEFGHLPVDREGGTISACWLFEGERHGYGIHMPAKDAEEGMEVATPNGWSYESSLSKEYTFVENPSGSGPGG